MSNLRAIKKRIGTVRNTQQITRAMKLVSGAKLRRAEERVRAFRPYADELRQTLTSLVARGEGLQHPLLQPGSSQAPRLYVLVSSDRGLCGAFNSNIIRTTLRHLEEEGLSPNDVVFYTVGRKSTEQAKRRGWQTLGSVAPLPEPPSPELVARIAGDLTEAFLAGAVGQVR
ncbi:MAG: F0F1 ATP synthase subunit gamma, partial [Candidatus Dadabacteria bacterium]